MRELLRGVVAFVAGDARQVLDLLRDALLLLEGERNRLDEVLELVDRLGDARHLDLASAVQQERHHHHRVHALLERLLVEEVG